MHQSALIRTGFALISAAALAASLHTRTDAAGVPAPTVTGPIASVAVGDASHDYPFFAAIVDLKARGWVEEEFFVEGTANRYTIQGQETAAVRDSGHPYKTRILVRRPASASAFNGTVVVEWNNVTAGRDLDIDWFQSYDHFIRSGYAWVGVTPQRVGVEALKVWNAKRYGTLDVTHGGAVPNDDLCTTSSRRRRRRFARRAASTCSAASSRRGSSRPGTRSRPAGSRTTSTASIRLPRCSMPSSCTAVADASGPT